MKNKYLLASTPILLGVICLVIKGMIGSSVEPDGTLQEAFFLIPLAYLFVFIGMILIMSVAILSFYKKRVN
ncbi:DUF3955 domain-containing protein [Sutcliffiella halmapala]|uniref:DUF3955 domain-containing protein n=1 Tax=Sutcliffiella halmapala TaxID=79882 RepID=UPI0009951CD4|nr:DUF3955 domain-containing protein [Sutcliffiella halmapala]